MKTEIEVKFCKVDIDDTRARLQKAGANCVQPMRLMRRQVFHLVDPDKNDYAYLRVRDEGDKTTMTYKQFADQSLHGASEAEVVVSDFATTCEILLQSGLQLKSYQETKRETWQIDGVEVVIDLWPWLEPFIEIEGPNEDAVLQVASKLNFAWDDAVFGGATEAYRASYPNLTKDMVMDDLAEIRFDLPLPGRLKA